MREKGNEQVCVTEAGNGQDSSTDTHNNIIPPLPLPDSMTLTAPRSRSELTVLAAATTAGRRAGDVWKAWDPTTSSERKASLNIVYLLLCVRFGFLGACDVFFVCVKCV